MNFCSFGRGVFIQNNGDGLLYEKEIGSQIIRYYYDDDMLLAENAVQDVNSVLIHYITGKDKELLIHENQIYFYVTDNIFANLRVHYFKTYCLFNVFLSLKVIIILTVTTVFIRQYLTFAFPLPFYFYVHCSVIIVRIIHLN